MTQAPTQSRALATTPADRIAAQLETRLPKFLEVAPAGFGEVGVRRLIRQAAIAVSRSPDLAKCTPASVALAVLQAVELGIDLASARPIAWIIPFKSEAKLMLGYQGLAEIAYREGAVSLIQARVVYAEDDFEIDYGDPARPFHHKPSIRGDRGAIVGAYAVADLPTTKWPAFEWMAIEDIEKVRKFSRGGNTGPWKDWYDQMVRKTPVRRICKILPTCPPKLARALELDSESDGLLVEDQPAHDARVVTNTARLSAAVGVVPELPEITTEDHASPGHPAHPPVEFESVEITADDIPF
jgi:recombination protein RecT